VLRLLDLLSRTRGPGLSTRAHLVLLVIALLVPILAFTGVLAHRYAAAERARFEQEAVEHARRIAALVDRDLAGLQTALLTLSTSARLRAGDYQGFYQQAEEVRGFVGEHVVLRDLLGQQLVSTRVPWGTALPRTVLDPDAEVIATRRPVVSNVFTGAVAGAPVFAIVIPVQRDGELTHLLGLSVSTDRLVPFLREGLKPEWGAGVFDRNGNFVARAQRHAEFSGRPGPKELIDQASGSHGIWRGPGLTGAPVLLGHAETLAGWRAYAGAQDVVIEAPLTRAIWLLAALGLALTATALGMAYTVGSQIAGSIKQLAANAASLGRGETVLPVQGPLREANEVARALSAASIGLRERARERDVAEAAMRASEARFRQLAEALPQLVWIMRADGEAIYCNQRCQNFYGEAWRDLTGRLSHIHPGDRANAANMRAEAVAAGRFFQVIVRLRSQKGRHRWHLLSVVPLEGEGEDAIWVGTATDIDDLRRAEEVNARLAAIVTASADAMMSFSVDGRVQTWNPAAEALFGYTEEEAIGAPASLLVPLDCPEGPRGVFDRALAGETVRTEGVRVAKTGERIEVAITAAPIRAGDGAVVGIKATMRDIREENAIERRQQLLINELNHRVKNTLATVQAIASQTLRSSATDQDARNAFEARLLALSKVHNVLTRQNWEAVSLSDVAAEVLAPHGGEDPARFRIDGPDVRLDPRLALPIAMALHELATNAVKYGPLSDGSGCVRIEWRLEAASEGRRLRLRWAEQGGPPVAPPTRKGFGSRLIERSLALELGGKVTIDYAPTGVVCTIEALLDHAGASAPSGEAAASPETVGRAPRAASA
jgi:PAS domain S-box-containing protein